jgi:1-deoxy-D-xylulose-5-phosphate reductoisomerase
MNKGLEVIEARWLFDVSPDRVDVVIHPQSIIHSMVEYRDTSVVAQLGLPDMRVPIAVAMAHPERVTLDVPRLDLAQQARLDFHAPDRDRFPCLDLAYRALRGSEQAPAVLNAANEVAVAAFLDRLIPFGAIADTNQRVLDAHLHESEGSVVDELDDVTRADAWAREAAREVLGLDAEAASAKTAESAAGQVG